jgi:hypothetical protein
MDSTAMTKEDYGDWDEVLANIPQNIHDNPESIDWGTPLEGHASDASSYIEPLRTDSSSRPSSNDRAWQNESVAKRRQLLLVATIGILSTVLAGLGFLGFLRSMSKPIAKDDPNKGLVTQQNADAPHTKGLADPPAIEPNKPNQEPPIGEPSNSGEQDNKANPLSSSDNLTPANNSTSELPAATQPDIQAQETLKPNLSSNDQEPASDANLSPSEIDKKLSDLFGPTGFGELLSSSSALPESGFGKKLTPEDLEIDDLNETKQLLFHPAPKVLPLWNETVEAQKLERIKFQNLPLSACVDFFSRATGVGITIDWESMRAAGLDEKMTLSCDFQKKNYNEILTELLDLHGLSIEVEDGFPNIRPKAVNTENQLASLDLSGRVPKGFEQKIAEQLVALWELEAKCVPSEGKIVWKPIATAVDVARVQSTLQLLTDNVANNAEEISATKKELGNDRNAAKVLQFDPNEWKEARSLLTLKIGNSVVIPEKRGVTEIMSIAFRELNSDLLIDWKNVWQHGLSPKVEDVSVFRNRTLTQVAGKYIDEYALEIVPIARNTMLLTTEAARRSQYIVVPIRCTEGTLEESKRALRSIAPKTLDGQSLFKLDPVAGLNEWYFARICRPRWTQIVEPELESTFGW